MDQANDISISFILLLSSILFMLLLSVAIIVFFLLYQKRLYAQQEQLQEQETNYQKDLLKVSIQAQEVERKRVATDLHDGIGSLLATIRLYMVQLRPKKKTKAQTEILDDATMMVDTAIEDTRNIAHNLLPTTLERFGAIFAIKDLCKRIEQTSEISIHLRYETAPRLTEEQDLSLYRIVQELLNNTLKHAAATEIDISFAFFAEEIKMVYTDNGKGFYVADDAQHNHGLGMRSIKSRAQLIDAELEIVSAPGAGFCLNLWMPLRQA